MSILDRKISSFLTTRNTKVINDANNTVGWFLTMIKEGVYKNDIQKIRDGDAEVKKKLPTIAFHGVFEAFREKKDFIEASGLIILDIDDIEDDLEDVKEDIMDSSNNILAVMISPSGNGIKVLYYVNPDIINAENYRIIGRMLVDEFSVYGSVDYLSVTDCLIMTYDPDILINEDAEPLSLYVPHIEVRAAQLEPVDKDKTLWTDVEDFFETVMSEDIAQKTNNNFHYIQVAMLDLGKYGFYHPQEDLSFVIHYAEEAFASSPKNKQRFMESAEIAKQYAQTKWAYKLNSDFDDEDDDEYVDYSAMKIDASDYESKEDEEEDDFDGMIDYDSFYKQVQETINEGDRVGFEVSFKNLANIFRLKGSGILTVTGIPGHGKTEMVDAIVGDLGRMYGHETFIVGFEQTPAEHVVKVMRKAVGTNITCPSYAKDNQPKIKEAYNFVTKYIKHINTTKTGGNINKILEYLAVQIKQSRDAGNNPKYVVIDPFNMLSIKGKFSGHEKIEEILRRLTHFSHQMGVLVILVAHPFKMKKDDKTGTYEVPDFYSVKGSSAFFEMSYHGLVVYRTGYNPSDPVFVRVLKMKQNNLGSPGEEAFFVYDKGSGRYYPIDSEGNELAGDHRDRDWIQKSAQQIINNNKTKN